jgi:hypothetical protein
VAAALSLFCWVDLAASKVGDQIADANAQSTGKAHKSVNANGLLAAFHFSNVDGMQVGFFCQLFLGEARPLPVLADGLANKFSLSKRCWHARLGKQEASVCNTVYNPLFDACLFVRVV